MGSLPCLPQWLKGDQVKWPMRKGLCQCAVNYYCYQVRGQSLRGSYWDGEVRERGFLCSPGRNHQKYKTESDVLKREDFQMESTDERAIRFLRVTKWRDSRALLVSRILYEKWRQMRKIRIQPNRIFNGETRNILDNQDSYSLPRTQTETVGATQTMRHDWGTWIVFWIYWLR